MTGSTVADRVLLLLLVVAVGLDLARLARPGASDPVDRVLTGREALVAHLLMNLAMVWMLTPWWSDAARTAVLIVVGALAVAFAGLLVAGLSVPALAERRAAHGYHLLATAAMVLAVAVTDHGQGGHGHHDAMAHAPAPPPAVAVVAGVLAVLFALDLLATVLVVTAAPRAALVHAGVDGGADERSRVSRLRVATVPHAVMDAGMVAMLVAVA